IALAEGGVDDARGRGRQSGRAVLHSGWLGHGDSEEGTLSQPSTSSAAVRRVAASPETKSVVTIDSRHASRSWRIFSGGPISDICSISSRGTFAPASFFLPSR